jgi:peptidoglycan-associated lipoprotein
MTSVVHRIEVLACSLVCMLVLLGCSRSVRPQAPDRALSGEQRVDGRIVLTPARPNADGQTCGLGTVYFDVDTALMDERAKETVLAAVSCFVRHGMPAELTITGGTDPRGTEEYNLALGQRRAAAVQGLLVLLGVSSTRISISSAGEELATGRDEDGWRLDRSAVAVTR